MAVFIVGDSVKALERLTEAKFMGKAIHVHAEKGDLGRIEGVDGEWLTVTWERTGTTTDCHASELAPPLARLVSA